MTIFTNLVSWSFVVGLIIGFVLSRLWAAIKVWRLDPDHPLASGRHRSIWHAMAVDPRAMAAVVGVAFLAWSVLQTQSNAERTTAIADDAKVFAMKVQQCQEDLLTTIRGSRAVTVETDRLNKEERRMIVEALGANREWIGSLITPPPEIEQLPDDDPTVQRYNIEVTRAYFDRAKRLEDRIGKIRADRDANEAKRPAYPDPRCGA